MSRKQYPFDVIERKWQRRWDEQQTFRAWNPGEAVPAQHPFAARHRGVAPESLRKYYILDMFPYPSGAGLHVGHPEGYTATDILARYRRMSGFHVLHPMGWDAFGLPAEQYAIRTGQHPRATTIANIATFKRQIKSLGFSYDWSREIDTTDPAYFQWTQWIFLQLYHSWYNPETNRAEPIATLPYPPEAASDEERRSWRDARRLAYVAEAPVNWCPELGTVLANEEVIEGKSEIGGYPVVRRPMRQWMLRITAYAERLLHDLDGLDWSESLKEMQRNWIGRSEGAEAHFALERAPRTITVYTTRPDTLFGATYLVLAPEHEWVAQLAASRWPPGTPDNWKGSLPSASLTPAEAVAAYRAYAAQRSDLERAELTREKTGVFTGAYALNPVNQERLPIWIADYVFASYGTGAIMAVPAHDTRDLDFAQKFGLPIRVVVEAPPGTESLGYVGDGVGVHSDFLNGLPTPEAKRKIIAWLEERGAGRRMVNYKLRDWLFSRQRYWGEPFPIVWRDGRHEALPESALPVLPPELSDFKPTATGEPPLARAAEWVNLPDGSQRETNTMPQWAGSCWYYLRYLDPRNARRFCGEASESYWMTGNTASEPGPAGHGPPARGIDLYIGGVEHAVLHLLYARFWHKVLFDLGHVSTPEPFYKLVNQGIILGEDNQKMSKARGNVVNPDDILSEYGADAFRLYEMFMGPLEMVKPWNTKGVEGVYRFLGRVWRLFVDEQGEAEYEQAVAVASAGAEGFLRDLPLGPAIGGEPTAEHERVLHACIKKVTEDLEGFRFNTAISALMIFVNEAMRWDQRPARVLLDFLKLLHPFAPHLAEELFAKMAGASGEGTSAWPVSLAYVPWPQCEERWLHRDTIEIPVQVNGKLRDRLVVAVDASSEAVVTAALASERVGAWVQGKKVVKTIVVPGKLVNIVVA